MTLTHSDIDTATQYKSFIVVLLTVVVVSLNVVMISLNGCPINIVLTHTHTHTQTHTIIHSELRTLITYIVYKHTNTHTHTHTHTNVTKYMKYISLLANNLEAGYALTLSIQYMMC